MRGATERGIGGILSGQVCVWVIHFDFGTSALVSPSWVQQ